MGQRTKIDWADSSWNPVTGCLHGCEYCYARGIARRFGGHLHGEIKSATTAGGQLAHVELARVELENPMHREEDMGDGMVRMGPILPYPYDFYPTLHRYALEKPQKWKKPRNIFVCSMADMFGSWVPDEWIEAVFDACRHAPQHRYLFLTKAPDRYRKLALNNKLLARDNFWYGTSTPRVKDSAFWSKPRLKGEPYYHTFVSIEPILERFGWGGKSGTVAMTEWVIVGAETGNRKGKVIPEKGWIMDLAEECDKRNKPIFMKESLRGIMGEDFRQEFPWEV